MEPLPAAPSRSVVILIHLPHEELAGTIPSPPTESLGLLTLENLSRGHDYA